MIVLGIDPSQKASALCAWDMERGPVALEVVRLARAGHTQADSIAVLRRLVGDEEWVGVIEKPPPVKRGARNAPSAARQHWIDALDLFAREQAAAKGERYRKPDVRHPLPHEWRQKMGIRTRGIGRDPLARRADLKAAAIAHVRSVLVRGSAVLEQHDHDHGFTDDEAEAICIAAWGAAAVRWEQRIADGAERWNVPAANLPPAVAAEVKRRGRSRTKGAA